MGSDQGGALRAIEAMGFWTPTPADSRPLSEQAIALPGWMMRCPLRQCAETVLRGRRTTSPQQVEREKGRESGYDYNVTVSGGDTSWTNFGMQQPGGRGWLIKEAGSDKDWADTKTWVEVCRWKNPSVSGDDCHVLGSDRAFPESWFAELVCVARHGNDVFIEVFQSAIRNL